MASNAIVQAVKSELAHYPGVDMELKQGGRHQRAVFFKDGNSRFLTLPLTASDWRSDKNAVRDFRKTMTELGAQRLDLVPGQRKGRRSHKAPASLALNHQALVLYFSAKSPLIHRFKGPDNKPTGVWNVELRASPDLSAPPLIVVRRTKMPPGKESAPGFLRGNYVPAAKGWALAMSRRRVPALTKLIDVIKPVDLQLYQDSATEMVFKLPSGVIPTGYTAKAPLPSEAWPEGTPPQLETLDRETDAPEAPEAAPAPATKEPVDALADKPIVLQFPRQAVSVEQAIAVLNKAKKRLGQHLRFTVTEGGYLTATHRIGY